jgi:tetratricopeptide (TPR) repeat protein
MSFVRTGSALLSAVALVWSAALGVEHCAAEAVAPAEFGAAPAAQPISAPATKKMRIVEAKRLAGEIDRHSKEPEVLRSNAAKLERLIEISKVIDGPTDEEALHWVYLLAVTRDQLNDVAGSTRLYCEFLTAADRASEEVDAEKAAALLRLARAETNQGALAQARMHAARVAEHFAADPNGAKREMVARKYLMIIESAGAAWPAALDHLERYVELTRSIRRQRLDDEIELRARYAYLCGADPKLHDRCREILDEACRTSAETFGPESAEAGSALQWLAMFQYRAADPTCVETLTAADRILTVSRNDTDDGAGYRRLRIAKYHRAFGRLDQARALYEAELKRLRAEPNTDSNRQAIALGFLAGIDAHQGRRPQAEQGYREAVRLVASRDDAIAKDLAPFFGKQRDELAAGRLPALTPADNADEVAARIMIP